ncbi:hypothetical protein J0K78_12505 [Halobacillus sp. GSS1]|uniref:hypothetical protein n=1 Tax=Halobacillus sp. GSS1 TaxID=2815919 RepID=UPI001A8C48BD|nr:hypothetical protein [Halobacillus sp. GSS1]MBN9655093.1 hypothetical protein [Halobacillus sp. GSS1]
MNVLTQARIQEVLLLPKTFEVYDEYVRRLMKEWGIYGREDEFIREGRATVYRLHKEKKETMDIDICIEIRKDLLKFFPSD